MMAAPYRPTMRVASSLNSRSLSALTDAISNVKYECNLHFFDCSSQGSDTHHHFQDRRRCLHSSPSYHPCLTVRNNDLLRRNDIAYKHYSRQLSSDSTRRKLLKGGRASRKIQLKQATHKKATSKSEEQSNSAIPPSEETVSNSNDNDEHHKQQDSSPKDMLLGVHIGNPLRERYIRSQQKINYPKTWSGWKDVFRRTKETYLRTHEGFLLPKKNRDEHGNIIPDDEVDNDDEDEADGKAAIKDKAKDAANQVAGNLQKNISTIQQEAPKLVKMGQEVTGMSSREELRAWVGEQLKLGTACLTEFMKGYRSGRDDEVDKMLHEYFKDLDEEKTETTDESGDDTDSRNPKQRRPWGRKERRRTKVMNSSTDSSSLNAANE